MSVADPARAPRSWGAHQEEAARALSQLILAGAADAARPNRRRGRLPGGLTWEPAHLEQLLWCREAILDAAGDQLAQLSGGRPAAALLAGTPTAAVAQLLLRRPRLDRSDATVSPAEMLASLSLNPTVELWRYAAVELTAGVHALAGAETRRWTSAPEAAWWLLGETATLTEAVVVLDAHLQRPGMLGNLDIAQVLDLDLTSPRTSSTASAPKPTRRMRGTGVIEAHRVELATVVSQARMYGTDPAAERATANTSTSPALDAARPTVVLIETVVDVVPAQQQLTRLLRGHSRRLSDNPPTAAGAEAAQPRIDRMNLALARGLVRTQLELHDRLIVASRRKPNGHRLVSALESEVEHLTAVAGAMEDLQEQVESRPPQGPATQAHELRTGLNRVAADLDRLDLTQLIAIGEAAHATTSQMARMTRSEFNHADGTISLRRRIGAQERTLRTARVRATFDAAARSQWPTEDLVPATTTARAALRDLLRDVRTSERTPSPFPAARPVPGDSGESPALDDAVHQTAHTGRRQADAERLRRGRATMAARRLAAKNASEPDPVRLSDRERPRRAASPSVKPPSQ